MKEWDTVIDARKRMLSLTEPQGMVLFKYPYLVGFTLLTSLVLRK